MQGYKFLATQSHVWVAKSLQLKYKAGSSERHVLNNLVLHLYKKN
jgi:hypothetical protein